MPEFDACFDALRRRHEDIDRVQVTNGDMEALILETGIAQEKLHRIPIGIDADAFRLRSHEERLAARRGARDPAHRRSSSARSRRTASAGTTATSRS